jgi:hypothetical protein
MLSVAFFCYAECHYAKYCYAECHVAHKSTKCQKERYSMKDFARETVLPRAQ